MATEDREFPGFNALESDLNVHPGEYDGAGNGRGDYTDWVQLVREILRPRFDTLEDFLPDSILVDAEERELVVMYIELAKIQMNAPVNNRRAELSRLNSEVHVLTQYVDDGGVPEIADEDDETEISVDLRETLDYLEITRHIDDDEEHIERLTELRDALVDQARVLRGQMEADRKRGQFRDYGALKAIFTGQRDPSQGIQNVGEVTLQLPPMLHSAFTLCKSTETNTRRRHAQAVLARLLDSGDSDNMMLQRALQGKPKRRPTRDEGD